MFVKCENVLGRGYNFVQQTCICCYIRLAAAPLLLHECPEMLWLRSDAQSRNCIGTGFRCCPRPLKSASRILRQNIGQSALQLRCCLHRPHVNAEVVCIVPECNANTAGAMRM